MRVGGDQEEAPQIGVREAGVGEEVCHNGGEVDDQHGPYQHGHVLPVH